MTLYRSVWLGVWATVVFVHVAFACTSWGLPAAAALFVLTGGVGGIVAAFRNELGSARAHSSSRQNAETALRTGCLVGVGAVAFVAIAEMNGGAAILALVLCCASSPRALGHVRAVKALLGHREADPPWANEAARPIQDMSDVELCRTWRESSKALRDGRGPIAKSAIVRLRQDCLAELEGRHPDAVEVWLASWPDASSGPEKYLNARNLGDQDA